MPSIIDSLVVTLLLDSSNFKKGTDDTTKSLDETKRKADAAAKGITESQTKAQKSFAGTGKQATGAATDIEKGAKRTSAALRSVDVQASTASKSIAESGKAMLAPFAEFALGLGAAVLSIDTIKKAIGQAGKDSATARTAQMSGIPVADLSTYGSAVALNGFSASAAEGTMANLAQQQQLMMTGQISPTMRLLEQLGIAPNQSIMEINKQLNRRLQGMPDARKSMILGQLQYDTGSAFLEEQTPTQYDALMAQGAKDRITPQQAAAELQISIAYGKLGEAVENLTRNLTVEAAPALIQFATTMMEFVNGFQQSAVFKMFEAANQPATTLNTINTDAQKAGAWVHKWVQAALHYPSSSANGLPGGGPRGMRNNNPLNLKYAGQPGATADSGGFAVFGSMDAGVSADYHQMLLDYGRGANTVNKLIPKWTTTDRGAYTATVLRKMKSYGYNINGDSQIDLTNPAVAQAMVASMSTAENGEGYWLPPAGPFQGLPKSVTGVLSGLRSQGRYGSSVTHNVNNITVHAPSGDAHTIAHVVKRELNKRNTQTNTLSGRSLG